MAAPVHWSCWMARVGTSRERAGRSERTSTYYRKMCYGSGHVRNLLGFDGPWMAGVSIVVMPLIAIWLSPAAQAALRRQPSRSNVTVRGNRVSGNRRSAVLFPARRTGSVELMRTLRVE